MKISNEKKVRINSEIRAPNVRLIGDDGEQIGIVSFRDAMERAMEKELDIVEISPNADPPVCRLMDFGKFKYEQDKKDAANKRKQKKVELKEIKFRPVTGEGDYQVKLRNLIRFLEQGDKVKVTLRYRGREMSHQELGMRLLERLQVDLALYGSVEQFPKFEGRQMVMTLGPKKK